MQSQPDTGQIQRTTRTADAEPERETRRAKRDMRVERSLDDGTVTDRRPAERARVAMDEPTRPGQYGAGF